MFIDNPFRGKDQLLSEHLVVLHVFRSLLIRLNDLNMQRKHNVTRPFLQATPMQNAQNRDRHEA